jgi:hypothetical protein
MRFACRIPKERIHAHNIWYLLLLYSNNSYANAPQYYVVRALPVLLKWGMGFKIWWNWCCKFAKNENHTESFSWYSLCVSFKLMGLVWAAFILCLRTGGGGGTMECMPYIMTRESIRYLGDTKHVTITYHANRQYGKKVYFAITTENIRGYVREKWKRQVFPLLVTF